MEVAGPLGTPLGLAQRKRSGITRNVCSVLGGCDCRRAAPPCGVARRDLGFWRTVDMGKGAGLVSLWGCDRHMKRH